MCPHRGLKGQLLTIEQLLPGVTNSKPCFLTNKKERSDSLNETIMLSKGWSFTKNKNLWENIWNTMPKKRRSYKKKEKESEKNKLKRNIMINWRKSTISKDYQYLRSKLRSKRSSKGNLNWRNRRTKRLRYKRLSRRKSIFSRNLMNKSEKGNWLRGDKLYAKREERKSLMIEILNLRNHMSIKNFQEGTKVLSLDQVKSFLIHHKIIWREINLPQDLKIYHFLDRKMLHRLF